MSDWNSCKICGKHYDEGCNRSCEEVTEAEDRIDVLEHELKVLRGVAMTKADESWDWLDDEFERCEEKWEPIGPYSSRCIMAVIKAADELIKTRIFVLYDLDKALSELKFCNPKSGMEGT